MAACTVDDFDKWLSVKLNSLNTDESVFGEYIKGILQGDESQDEKIEALEGIFAEISPADGASQTEICQEIMNHWQLFVEAVASKDQKETDAVSVDIRIAKIMEQQAQCVVPQRKQSEEAKKLKQSILSQYAEVSASEDEDGDEEGGSESGDEKLLPRNTNAEDVMKLDKLKKETLRLESQKKKDKDKEDRERQKQLAIDRKEKEKKRTQKGEKKR
uniref:Coiled-coil domain-containing protein 43 n=1 Tax=Moina brachiata TaxID=675436 RepID=A0A4Y7NL65_9CRUS|nr:EOG090X0H15 [Moina brachiata]SVE93346.1 EOG090X0H15 [Moina brachiata]